MAAFCISSLWVAGASESPQADDQGGTEGRVAGWILLHIPLPQEASLFGHETKARAPPALVAADPNRRSRWQSL